MKRVLATILCVCGLPLAASAAAIAYSVAYEASYASDSNWALLGDKSSYLQGVNVPGYDPAWVHEMSIYVETVSGLAAGEDLYRMGLGIDRAAGLTISTRYTKPWRANSPLYEYLDGEGHPASEPVFSENADGGLDGNDLVGVLASLGSRSAYYNHLGEGTGAHYKLGSVYVKWSGDQISAFTAYGYPASGSNWIIWTGNGSGTSTTIALEPAGTSVPGAFLFGVPEPATTWRVPYGNWSDANNWSGGEPNVSMYAYVGNGGTATITAAGEVCRRLRLGWNPGEDGNVTILSGSLYVSEVEHVGYSGTGTLTQSDGNHTVSQRLHLGYSAGSVGTYQLSGNGRLTALEEFVGAAGQGFFLQTGGTNTCGHLSIGLQGRYELRGGSLRVSGPVDSNGVLDLSAGTGAMAAAGPVTIRRTGQLLLGGSSLGHTDANLFVNIRNDGNVRITGGSHVVGSLLPVDPNLRLGAVQVDANASLNASILRQDTLTVGAGATAILRGSSKTTSVLNMLEIAGVPDAWTGTVDIKHNALVVQSATGPDANAAYETMVSQARYACDNLNWDRPGLTSTLAQADTRKITGVAVVLNRDDSTAGSPAFLSVFDPVPDANLAVSVDTRCVLVKYTWYGDADLNGIVDERDLDRFSTGYSDQRAGGASKGLTGWAWGDFDNSATVDERDLDLFSTAYSNHGGPLAPDATGQAAVPEPASLAALAGAALCGALRRGSRRPSRAARPGRKPRRAAAACVRGQPRHMLAPSSLRFEFRNASVTGGRRLPGGPGDEFVVCP